MRKTYAMGILMVSVCVAQTQPPTPKEIEAMEAALRADLRETEDLAARNPIQPRASDQPSAGSISVAQLRHKPPKDAQKSMVRGATYSQAGDHRRAAEEFERAVAADPEFANAHDRLGVEYARLGRYEEAEAELQRALAVDPASWIGHYDLGVILYQTGDLSGAERSVRRALELSKSNVEVSILLGLLLWRNMETRGQALEYLQYAARTSPQAKDLLASLKGE
jgi:tetratricopeptide (TPR) repeat protein